MIPSEAAVRTVAFLIWSLEAMGGSEKVVFDIATRLDRKRFRPILISQRDGRIREWYERAGVRVLLAPQRSAFDFGAIVRLRRLLATNEVQLLHAHHLGPFVQAYWATVGSRARLVFTEHSVWQLEEMGRFGRILLRRLLRMVDGIVAVSTQLVDYYREIDSRISERTCLIMNGIDVERFAQCESHLTRADIGVPDDALVVGIVANLRPEKNHLRLVGSFARLACKDPRVHLVLVGADFMDGEIQRAAERTGMGGRVHFLGARDDVPSILRLFDVYCLPSEHEGLPLNLLEAMAASVPVVCSDVMGINEVVRHMQNGVLVPPGDEAALAEALHRVLSDKSLRMRLSENGLSYVQRNHDVVAKVEEYGRFFDIALASGR